MLRCDKVLVFIVAGFGTGDTGGASARLLQLRRSDEPMRGTWQPVMGTIEPGETAPAAAVREVREETGLDLDRGGALYQLDGVHPFYMASRGSIYLCPCFVAAAPDGWSPTLNTEHEAHRWVTLPEAASTGPHGCTWPGQRASVAEIIEVHAGPQSARDALRLDAGDA